VDEIGDLIMVVRKYEQSEKLENNLLQYDEIKHITNNFDVVLDIVRVICGKMISYGLFRDVYEYNLDDKYVVKIERGNTDCNLVEYMLWSEIKGLKKDLAWVKDWFAPILWISPNNKIIVMRKTKYIPNRKKPETIPKFMWDVCSRNFGWIGNRFVCHDYGQFYNFINYDKKMRKVIWD